MAEDRRLTQKQETFARVYATEARGNGRLAAELAGYEGDANTLMVQASRNLDNPRVVALMQSLTDDVGAGQRAILQELADVGFAHWRESIEIMMRNGEVIRVKMDLASKVKALELLGKNQQLWTEKIDVTFAPKAIIGINLDDDL